MASTGKSKGHQLCSNSATLKLNKSEVASWLSLVEGTDWSIMFYTSD